jgi:dimethylaniline monooxygenase (N-oxide forming)
MYRRQLPRRVKGAPIDHTHSMRLFTIQSLIFKHLPRFGERMFDKFVKKMQNESFNIRPEWRFEPAGKVPVVSDTLVPCLQNGSLESVQGIKRVLGATEVELEDESTLDVDAMIWCTGYKSDFSLLDARYDPTSRPQSWLGAPGSNGKSLFRLHHNIFSLEKPDSLAFLGNVHVTLGGFQIFDMASMAITQVWAGHSSLPPLPTMSMVVDRHQEWLADQAQRTFNISPGQCDAGTWVTAMDDLAGTGVNEYLGYGWKGWLFWWKERRFCNLLMGGIWSPHIHRVFEGKRAVWEGARSAIEGVNERVARMSGGKEKAA